MGKHTTFGDFIRRCLSALTSPPLQHAESAGQDGSRAYSLGWDAFDEGEPISSNPYPWNAEEREEWSNGWRAGEMSWRNGV